MMNQFTIINGYLCIYDMSSWNMFYGFGKPIVKLYQTEWN
jgi:hypothetical protein